MESAKYVIVGGGAAGTTAAATIRQHDPDGRIVLISQEPHPLYSRTSLVPYMRHEVSRENLFLRNESYYKKQSIDWLTQRAVGLDGDQNLVTLDDGTGISFDKLLIASGSRPKAWSIPGSTLDGIYSLRTIDDADHILKQLKSAKHVTIVGGGFITLELIQLLTQLGIATQVIIRGPYYWSNVLDEESGKLLQQLMDAAPNITIHYNSRVDAVVGEKKVESVILSNGRQHKADVILAHIGIDFNTDWLDNSGIEIEKGVVVNQYLQTNIENIYAAGDIALFYDPLIGIYHQQGNWNNATFHGQVAGQNMTGHQTEIAAVTSYSINFMGKDISFLGQTSLRTSITAVPRGSARHGAYGRILVGNGQVIGATLINRFGERSAISRLISAQVDVSKYLADLADESVPLNHLAKRLGA